MSRAAKLTLAGTTIGTAAIVVLVHYQQNSEKAAMHAGVIRDIEQQRVKKERQADFEMQRALEEEYRKVQEVHDGGGRRPVEQDNRFHQDETDKLIPQKIIVACRASGEADGPSWSSIAANRCLGRLPVALNVAAELGEPSLSSPIRFTIPTG